MLVKNRHRHLFIAIQYNLLGALRNIQEPSRSFIDDSFSRFEAHI